MRFLSFTSFGSLIKEIKRCERKKPQAETTRRYRSVHLAVVVSCISEDFLGQARVTVAILLIVHG